jgi:hypothetical protein
LVRKFPEDEEAAREGKRKQNNFAERRKMQVEGGVEESLDERHYPPLVHYHYHAVEEKEEVRG